MISKTIIQLDEFHDLKQEYSDMVLTDEKSKITL